MDKHSDWVVLGRFGRPHGVKGMISIISFTEPRDNLLQYPEWHVKIRHQWQPLDILQIESNVKQIIAKVAGFDEREDVAELTNCDIAVPSKYLPALEAGEYYWHQLIGLNVLTPEGIELGVVSEVKPTGSNDVLVVIGAQKKHLIPYLPGLYVLDVDLSAGRLIADWDPDF